MSYCVEPDHLGRFSEFEPSWAVDPIRNFETVAAAEAFIAAARNRQAKLILENTLAAARDSVRAAADLVYRRANTTTDSFLRHQLLATAREVSAIDGVLERNLWPAEPGPPCLIRTLQSEISKLERFCAGRIGKIDHQIAILKFSPSWTSQIIFRLLVREFIYDVFVNAEPELRLSLRLWLDRDMICFSIDGAGYCTEQAFMLRIGRPKHFQRLLESLSGTLRSTVRGISIRFPVAACTALESAAEEIAAIPSGPPIF
jgi:hypothetical protein